MAPCNPLLLIHNAKHYLLLFITYLIYVHLMNSHISVAFIRPWILRQNAEVLNDISPQHALRLCSISQLILSL